MANTGTASPYTLVYDAQHDLTYVTIHGAQQTLVFKGRDLSGERPHAGRVLGPGADE